ncbi:hypothetical protein EfmAA96_05860 [Enterococcus faecium]|nr:hypothetical protein EfmAA96_05860 [Enterococcus faecium]
MTTVIRTLKEFKSYLPKQSKKILPRVLMVDEFRSHASIEDKMSFICADGETGKLIDVLPTRKLPRLTSYFLGCTNPEEVEFLVTDMNAAYFQLTKRVLPNAKVVIDRFHIVKHIKKAFNELRLRESLLLCTQSVFAENKSSATTEGTISVTKPDAANPEDVVGIPPVDPNDPDTPFTPDEPNQGTSGLLTIDQAPDLDFGTITFETKTLTYFSPYWQNFPKR